MANFTCILCIFKIQNTVFVFKYIFPHSILYFYFKYILMYLCPSLLPWLFDWHWHFTLDPPWVSCEQSTFVSMRQSRCRQEWLLSDWGVLLLDVIMNIAVVIYSQHLNHWRRRGLLFLKGMHPLIYLNVFMFDKAGSSCPLMCLSYWKWTDVAVVAYTVQYRKLGIKQLPTHLKQILKHNLIFLVS